MTKRIAVFGLGGTIAMTPGSDGLRPSRSVQALIDGVAGRWEDVNLVCHEICMVPSASIGLDVIDRVARLIDDCAGAGFAGVVVVQGTDTMEETAFALELLCEPRLPVILTGAMRSADHPGAEGAANLRAAITTVLAAPAGVFVVMNDELHAARYVSKRHATALDAFASVDTGPMARIHEGRLRGPVLALPGLGRWQTASPAVWPRVALLKIAIGDDATLVDAVTASGFAACVLDAMGAGHVPAEMVDAIATMAGRMPVMLCSRTGAGRVCENTYAYPGSEVDLLSRGVIGGGRLSALKTRILLSCALRSAPENRAQALSDVVDQI